MHEGRRQTNTGPAHAGSRLKLTDALGRRRPKCHPSSRTGENPPYGMIGGIEETSASFEARSAPRSYPTGNRGRVPPPVTRWMWKQSHGRTSEAPPDERGGYRYVRPTATAPHLDSTLLSHRAWRPRARAVAPKATKSRGFPQ